MTVGTLSVYLISHSYFLTKLEFVKFRELLDHDPSKCSRKGTKGHCAVIKHLKHA